VKIKSEKKKEKTNTSIGSSSSSSSKNETSENFDKMEKGTQNSDCGQEPGDVDINKEKKSKMNPVPATEQVCTYSMSHQDLSLFLSYNNYIGPCLLVCHINLDQDLSLFLSYNN
jgi:hypothetical protein